MNRPRMTWRSHWKHRSSMSGDGRSARLKSDANGVQMLELGVGGQVQEFDRLRKQQQRRGRKQDRVGQRDNRADRAVVALLLIGIRVGSWLLLSGLGCRIRGHKA